MKIVLVLLIIAAGAYYFVNRPQAAVDITNPVYAEIRIEVPVASRQLDLVLFGKMADENDCQNRSDIAWGNMIEGCATCKQTISTCKTELEPRYLRLFDNTPVNTAYLSFTRGESTERDGRMVIWGVTEAEGNVICEGVRAEFQKHYKGKVECIAGHAE